jgi:CubicO group peptidase (beta-lactamase class C family)
MMRSHTVKRFLIIGVLIVLLTANPGSARMAYMQAYAAASGGIPPQLTSSAQVDAYLTQAHFHGYILQVRHGRTILGKGYGMADVQRKTPIVMQTRWPMFGGIDTFMVAMAILKLQQDGKLTLRDKLCTYLTGCPQSWRGMAIQVLLDGTSEIGYYDSIAYPGTIDHSIAQCEAATPLSAPPGVSEDSSCNRVLLSRVISRASREPFGTAMRQLVFRPAGMTSTGVVNRVPPQSARGYKAGTPAPLLHFDGYPLIYSTPGDILRLDRALLAGAIISPRSVRALITPYRLDAPDPGLTIYNGYGCQMVKANQFFFPSVGRSLPIKTNRIVFENGGRDWSGFMIDNFLSPDDGTIAIELVNDNALFDNGADNSFVERTAQLLWGK